MHFSAVGPILINKNNKRVWNLISFLSPNFFKNVLFNFYFLFCNFITRTVIEKFDLKLYKDSAIWQVLFYFPWSLLSSTGRWESPVCPAATTLCFITFHLLSQTFQYLLNAIIQSWSGLFPSSATTARFLELISFWVSELFLIIHIFSIF